MHLFIMILVIYRYIISCFCIIHPSMEKSSMKISKSNSTTSLPMVHAVLKNYSALSRCNSFSSTSSDSAVYCGSTQTNLKNGKRLASDNLSTELPKRSRNSSGSSISSNMSCVSDKDLKSSVLSQSPKKSPVKINSIKNTSPPLNLLNGAKLKDETKEPAQKESISIPLPSQRILRRQITKKGCTCCPSTRTTVVVRRYQEIFKTSTVISSTKVKTYVQKSSLSNTIQNNQQSNKSSPKSATARKSRKSEVEKLYESLHEIEWAKNFSPDNILRQINVRQAASCSVFGKCHTKNETVQHKNSKKPKSISNCNESSLKPSNAKNEVLNSKGPSKEATSSENRQHCDMQIKASESKTKQTSDSNNFLCEPNFKSCDSQSSVNITCSVSHINVKEINIKSTESVHRTQSLLTVNGEDYSDDAQLLYTSDESSSAISSSIVNLQSKHLLDLDYKDRTNRDSSDVDISELSATPTFFDIAEEGIRTIDACFREVGAEVVVSTCVDENSLPSLQSSGENALTKKGLNDDGPPILEPCISGTPSQNSKDVCNDSLQKKVTRKLENIKNCLSISQQSDDSDSGNFNSDENYAKFNTESLNKSYSYLVYKNNRDLLLLKAGKRVLNKYLKFLYSKSQPKLTLEDFSTANIIKNLTQVNYDSDSEQFVNCDNGSEQSYSDDNDSEQSRNVDTSSEQSEDDGNSSEQSDNDGSNSEKSDHDDESERFDNANDISEQLDNTENISEHFDNDENISEHFDNDENISEIFENGISSSSEQSDGGFENEDDFSEMNESKILYNSFMRPALPYPMPVRIPQTASKINHQTFNNELSNEKCSSDTLKKSIYGESESSSSFVYNSFSSLRHESNVETFITSKLQSVSKQKSIISSFVSPSFEEGKTIEPAYRPLSAIGSCPSYDTIKVNRCTNYTQIILKLTRGKSIFLTVQALTELTDAVTRIGNDTSCAILILNGIGESFCLGLDLKALVGPRKNITTTEMANAVKEFIETLSHFKKPLAAVVNGPAVGLGMTLLNHADFTISSNKATFCMPNVFLGYMPEGGATLTLPQAVGSTVASDLLLRGTQLSAEQALKIGLVTDVVKAQCLPEELVSRVRKIAGGSLSALETTKSILKMQLHVNLRLVLENEVKLLPRMWLTRTCQDAMRKALIKGLLS